MFDYKLTTISRHRNVITKNNAYHMIRNTFLLCGLVCMVASCSSVKSNQEKNNSNQSILMGDSLEPKANSDKDYLKMGFDLMNNEQVGEIKIGLTYEKVLELLGEPQDKSKAEMSEADGLYYQSIGYQSKGIDLVLVVDADSVKRVSNILIKEPCALTTSKQIGIGSGYDEVEKAYKEFINPEFSDNEYVVLGTVYGGIVITLENKKVKTIYVGVSAD